MGPAAVRAGSTADVDRELDFEAVSLEQGLSQSIVQCILQDRTGFLWCGTEDGLNRFDGYEFRVFRHCADDPTSLTYSEIQCLLERPRGEIWVGTFGGLNLFDPGTETFRRFVHSPADPKSLGGESVRALLEGPEGRLWIGLQGGGLDRLDVESRRFVHHRHDAANPNSLAHDDVRALHRAADGRLWVGTLGGGLDRFDHRSGLFEHHRHDPSDDSTLSDDRVTVLFEDGEGSLWVGTEGGLNRYDESSGRFERWALEGQAKARITAICEGDGGRLWIGTDGGGLLLLDPDRGRVLPHRHHPKRARSLSGDRIRSCYRDRSGVLWVGAYGAGLCKGDRRLSRFVHYRHDPEDPQSLSHKIVWSLCEDRRGRWWVGTDAGIDRFDRRRGAVSHFSPDVEDPTALGHPEVRVVYEGPSGDLWVGTNGGLFRFDPESEGFEPIYRQRSGLATEDLPYRDIRCLYEEEDRSLWIGTLGSGLYCRDAETGSVRTYRHDPDTGSSLASDFVRCLHRDARGRFWVGTQGGGLDRLDPRTGRCRHHRHDPSNRRTLSSNYVFSIWEDSRGVLWLGTYAGGLDRFDPRTGRVERFGTAQGLPANLIYGVLGDDDGRLWVSTNRGLARFDPERGRFRTFDRHDGLQSDEFNGGSYCRTRSGELLFGGIDGFNAFDPRRIVESEFEPSVVLTDFQLGGRSVCPGEVIRGRVPLAESLTVAEGVVLSHRDRVLSVQFASLDFANPRKNRYAYRMVGFDEGWRETGADRRFATYTNLPPGRYRFEVRGSNSDGVWSPHRAALGLTIRPPFWSTWWFRSLAAGGALGALARSYRQRVGRIRLAAELAAAAEAQRSTLPERAPEVPGFEIDGTSLPASEVGGDFFDYLWRDDARRALCIAVGDVAGKGMEAAMRAVMFSGMILARLEAGDSLERILRSLNRLAFARTPEHRFTALCLAVLSVGDRHLTYVNAGLPEPLLRTRSGVRFLPTPDPRYPLGIHPEEPYRETSVELEEGDVVVLYSDGLPEAQNRSGEVYGYRSLARRLARLPPDLGAAEIREALLDDVRRFEAGAAQKDDRTLVVVRVGAPRAERRE